MKSPHLAILHEVLTGRSSEELDPMDIYLRGSLLEPGLPAFCHTPWSGCRAQASTSILCLRQGCASMCLFMNRYLRSPSARLCVSAHASVCIHSCHRWLGGVLSQTLHRCTHQCPFVVSPSTHHRPRPCMCKFLNLLLADMPHAGTWSQNCACYHAGRGLHTHPKHTSYTGYNHLTIVQCYRSHRQPAMHELQQLGISEGVLQASS